jgi:hypothetical protein
MTLHPYSRLEIAFRNGSVHVLQVVSPDHVDRLRNAILQQDLLVEIADLNHSRDLYAIRPDRIDSYRAIGTTHTPHPDF